MTSSSAAGGSEDGRRSKGPVRRWRRRAAEGAGGKGRVSALWGEKMALRGARRDGEDGEDGYDGVRWGEEREGGRWRGGGVGMKDARAESGGGVGMESGIGGGGARERRGGKEGRGVRGGAGRMEGGTGGRGVAAESVCVSFRSRTASADVKASLGGSGVVGRVRVRLGKAGMGREGRGARWGGRAGGAG